MYSDALNTSLTKCVRIFTIPGFILGHLSFWPFAPAVILCGLGLFASMIVILSIQLVYYISSFFIWVFLIVPILRCCFDEAPTDLHADMFMEAPMTAWVSAVEAFFYCIGMEIEEEN